MLAFLSTMNKMRAIFLTVFLIITGKVFADSSFGDFFFSENQWIVKERTQRAGPGPNYFSYSSIDENSHNDLLELSIIKKWGRWYCGEIYTRESFSYGTFNLKISLPGNLDSQAVFGFFLYNDKIPPYFNEIDFEIAHWGIPGSTDAHFTVQPYTTSENIHSFNLPPVLSEYIVSIEWTEEAILFSIFEKEGALIQSFEYSGENIPRETRSRVHINLWLFQGKSPQRDGGLSIYVSEFYYTPYQVNETYQ